MLHCSLSLRDFITSTFVNIFNSHATGFQFLFFPFTQFSSWARENIFGSLRCIILFALWFELKSRVTRKAFLHAFVDSHCWALCMYVMPLKIKKLSQSLSMRRAETNKVWMTCVQLYRNCNLCRRIEQLRVTISRGKLARELQHRSHSRWRYEVMIKLLFAQ